MTLGEIYEANVDGKPRQVYRSMYDLPKGETALTRWRYADTKELVPKECEVKLGEKAERKRKA